MSDVPTQVLVVSQSSAERRRAVSALQLTGQIRVVEADSPFEARSLAGEQAFDVLVVDGDLEPMGGFSLVYELRAAADMAGETSPPAVVLTSRAEDRWLAGWAGANRTVAKPVDSFVLAREVSTLVGRSPAARDAVEEAAGEVAEILDDPSGTGGLAPEV